MLRTLRNTTFAMTAVASTTFSTVPQRVEAQSYQIDCAILLCLSGGWPASVPCAKARTEFIRRITPWPVEPPLQIWQCPMGAVYTVDPEALASDRIYDIRLELENNFHQQLIPELPQGSAPSPFQLTGTNAPQPPVVKTMGRSVWPIPEDFVLQLIQDRADIDISGAEFNFVRSIRVFDARSVRQYEAGSEGDCERSQTIRLGTYGTQGDFRWTGSSVEALPDAHVGTAGFGLTCPSIYHRSVFVEWRDYVGNYGFEQVNY